jgi:hypothetical protein
MDPLSVTASVVALLTLAVQVGAVIAASIKDDKKATKELIQIGQEVQSLRSVLCRLKIILEEERLSNALGWQSGAFTAADIEPALGACLATMREIQVKTNGIKSLIQGGGSFDKVRYQYKWSSVRKDLQDLRARLEYSKTSILMSLQLRSL